MQFARLEISDGPEAPDPSSSTIPVPSDPASPPPIADSADDDDSRDDERGGTIGFRPAIRAPRVPEKDWWTAVRGGNVGVVNQGIAAGQHLEARTGHFDETPLMVAALWEGRECVRTVG